MSIQKNRGSSHNAQSHPYMRPGFFLKPENQFWLKGVNNKDHEAYKELIALEKKRCNDRPHLAE